MKMKYADCPSSDTHTTREIERDEKYITFECTTCKTKMYEPLQYSQVPITEIQQGTVMIPEYYDTVPDFQEDIYDDEAFDKMCTEYLKLTSNN